MMRKAVDPVTDPVDTMQSDALDSYCTRLAANDAAHDLARERLRQAAASPADEPSPDSSPGASAPASTPQRNNDDTVQPKSNTLLQLAVVPTMLCVGPWCEVNDEFREVIERTFRQVDIPEPVFLGVRDLPVQRARQIELFDRWLDLVEIQEIPGNE